MTEPVRLQRFLATAGVAARRKAEALITAGRVTVNGKVVTTLGTKVHPDNDDVLVDGHAVVALDKFYVLLNKPKGCITSVTDDRGRATVMDYLPNVPVPVKPVGRLDYYTEGVLLLTNDGELASKLLSPSSHVQKTYHAKVHGTVSLDQMKLLRKGVQLDDGFITQPAEIQALPSESKYSWIAVTIHEGKHHQVHRMFEALGFRVDKLQRVAFATLTFHNLRIGDARELTQQELNELRDAVGLDHSAVSRGRWHAEREETDIPRRARAKQRLEAEQAAAINSENAAANAARRAAAGDADEFGDNVDDDELVLREAAELENDDDGLNGAEPRPYGDDDDDDDDDDAPMKRAAPAPRADLRPGRNAGTRGGDAPRGNARGAGAARGTGSARGGDSPRGDRDSRGGRDQRGASGGRDQRGASGGRDQRGPSAGRGRSAAVGSAGRDARGGGAGARGAAGGRDARGGNRPGGRSNRGGAGARGPNADVAPSTRKWADRGAAPTGNRTAIGVRASGADREPWRGSSGTGEKAPKRARYGKGGPASDAAPDAAPSARPPGRAPRVDLGAGNGDRSKPGGGSKGRWSQSDRDKRDARDANGSGGFGGARGARGRGRGGGSGNFGGPRVTRGGDGDAAPKSRTFGRANPTESSGGARSSSGPRSAGPRSNSGGSRSTGGQGRSFGKRPGARGPRR